MAAYRDRYGIPDDDALGAATGSDVQKVDTARAGAALRRARQLSDTTTDRDQPDPAVEVQHGRTL